MDFRFKSTLEEGSLVTGVMCPKSVPAIIKFPRLIVLTYPVGSVLLGSTSNGKGLTRVNGRFLRPLHQLLLKVHCSEGKGNANEGNFY